MPSLQIIPDDEPNIKLDDEPSKRIDFKTSEIFNDIEEKEPEKTQEKTQEKTEEHAENIEKSEKTPKEKQKEALKTGRMKGLETRRKKKKEKEEIRDLEITRKTLQTSMINNNNNVNIEEAITNGIERYEKIRKERKAKKKADMEQNYIKSTLQAGQIPTQNIQGLSRRQQLLNLI